MREAFDDLAKALASGMSRREALKRFGIAAAGTLFFFRPGAGHTASLGKGKQAGCKDFCAYLYGYNSASYTRCVNRAKSDKGECHEWGPESEACEGNTCPQGTFCVSNAFNFNFNGHGKAIPSSYHCVPNKIH